MDFQTANQKVHKVEDQWHFPHLAAHGFVALTKEAVGFVRNYHYEKDGLKITCVTGVSGDYWSCSELASSGYWADLEPFLKGLA